MPMFVFISGYFSKKKDKYKLKADIWKLLEPLIIYQIVAVITEIIFKGFTTLISILTPWFILWYLLSLIYWRLLLQIIPDRILDNTKLVIISTFFISIIAGYFPFDTFLSLQRTFAFMPFFFLGYCVRNKNLHISNKYKPISFFFLILIIIIPLFFPKLLGALGHYSPYDNVYGALQRLFVFILAIPMSIAFMNICPTTAWVAKQGKLSMQYFIYHALIVTPMIAIATKLNIPMNYVSGTIFWLIIVISIGCLSRLHNFTIFTNPSLINKGGYN